MYLSTHQAINLWDELLSAFYGKNSYGDHTAEIYLSNYMEYCPHYAANAKSEFAAEAVRKAHYSVHEILLVFQRKHACKFQVEGMSDIDELLTDRWIGRFHITVTPDNDNKRTMSTVPA